MNELSVGVVACESMCKAIEECVASMKDSFRIYPIIPSCTFTVGIDLFKHYLDRSIIENDVTLLAYGTCHPKILELLAEYGDQVIKVKGNNCYEMFLGTEKYAEYHKKCYWMLNEPFFTKWKKDILVGWGAGTVNGIMLIEDAYKKLVYLRLEKDQLDINLVKDFADNVGLEYEVHTIDTGNLKRLLEETLASASRTRRIKLPASSSMHPSQPDVQTILENIGEIIYRIDVHTKEFTFVSPQVETILGYTPPEFIDIINNHIIAPFYYEDEREKVTVDRYDFLIKCVNEGMQEPYQGEYRVIHKNGNLLWVRESVYPIYSSGGVIESFVGKIVDISERKQAEEALRKAHNNLEKRVMERTAELEGLTEELKNEILERQHIERDLNQLNRAYLMVCECSQELIRIADEQSLLNNICRIIIETGGYRLAWVGFAEHDENKSVIPVASAGYEEGYLESIHITWADEPRGRGPTGTAIRTGRPAIARNIPTDPQFAPWRDRAIKRGYASSIALPLHIDQENIGALNIYAKNPEAFDEEEVNLLIKLADNLAYGITSLRMRDERNRAEEALRESEELYRTLVETAPAGVSMTDLEGQLIFVSQRIVELHGYERADELLGRNALDLIAPEDREKATMNIQKILEEGSLREQEVILLRKDGTHFIGGVNATALKGADGQPRAFITTTRDITERKRTEEALGESEEKYRTIFENVSDSITFIDKYGTIISANDKAEIFGRKPEEIIGKRFTELGYFDVRDIPKYLKLLKDVITGKKTPMQMELEIKHKDGHKIPVETSTSLVKRSGKTVGFVCMTRDITERKRAEEALKDSEERFRAVVQSAKDSIILIDNKGIIQAWNKAADILFQHDESDVIGKVLHQIIVPERYYETFKSGFKHFKTSGKGTAIGKTLELTALRKDGVEFPIEMSLSAIKLREQWHAIGIIRDITERKRAEAELKATQEQLRNLSTHLQSVREEDQAMLAREIHDELGQALTTLKFGIVEIKNTLPADQISLVKEATSMAEYVDTIAQTVNVIATRLRPTLLDELGLVEAIEWEVEQFEDRTGIKCELTIEPEEMAIDQDRSTATYRITQEALTNIARHAQATRCAVTLKMSGGKLHLRITDNGIGIAEDWVSNPKSLGIIGMRERVLSVGGNFEINRIKKGGTKIMVIIPVENES